MTVDVLYGVAIYLAGVYASYTILKDIAPEWKYLRIISLFSWLTFICYLIACNYNEFDD